jgi:hypothetical protein
LIFISFNITAVPWKVQPVIIRHEIRSGTESLNELEIEPASCLIFNKIMTAKKAQVYEDSCQRQK